MRRSTTYLVSQLLHARTVTFAHALLMVTQDGDHTIGFVICSKLLRIGSIDGRPSVELLLKGDGGVVRTEDFGGETFHVRLQMLIQTACLRHCNSAGWQSRVRIIKGLTFTRSNNASPSALLSALNSLMFLKTCGSTSTVLKYLSPVDG